MTPEEAKRLLRIHAGLDADTDPARWERGFVCIHRSAPDDAGEENFLEIMECIRVLTPEIAASPTVDRELMAALWGLIFLPRMWAFNPRHLEDLFRNRHHRLDGDRLSRLADQLDRISEAVDYALNGVSESVEDAMIEYGEPLPNYIAAVRMHAEPGASSGRPVGD
jgi:hypothetical protein